VWQVQWEFGPTFVADIVPVFFQAKSAAVKSCSDATPNVSK
jgi:hypothetical protein